MQKALGSPTIGKPLETNSNLRGELQVSKYVSRKRKGGKSVCTNLNRTHAPNTCFWKLFHSFRRFEVWGFPNMGGVRNLEREAQAKILRRLAQAYGLALVAENASRPKVKKLAFDLLPLTAAEQDQKLQITAFLRQLFAVGPDS